jgi:hypothetical protein
MVGEGTVQRVTLDAWTDMVAQSSVRRSFDADGGVVHECRGLDGRLFVAFQIGRSGFIVHGEGEAGVIERIATADAR